MELGSARPAAPAAAPTPCNWTSSSWPRDPGYSWEGPQTVSKHVKYGWMWIMPQKRLLKTIKIFWKVSFIYLVFIISLHPLEYFNPRSTQSWRCNMSLCTTEQSSASRSSVSRSSVQDTAAAQDQGMGDMVTEKVSQLL